MGSKDGFTLAPFLKLFFFKKFEILVNTHNFYNKNFARFLQLVYTNLKSYLKPTMDTYYLPESKLSTPFLDFPPIKWWFFRYCFSSWFFSVHCISASSITISQGFGGGHMLVSISSSVPSDQAYTSFWCAVLTRTCTELWRCADDRTRTRTKNQYIFLNF